MAAMGAEGLSPPQQVIENTVKELQGTLKKEDYRRDFVKAVAFVEKTIEPSVDFNRMAALVLGQYWREASEDQKRRFIEEFRTLLVRTYTTAFTEYADWTVHYLPLAMQPGDKKALVRTEILQPGAQPFGVNFRMLSTHGQWKAYDVVIEGISLVRNYRTSFSDELARTGSLEGLIEHLAERNRAALSKTAERAR